MLKCPTHSTTCDISYIADAPAEVFDSSDCIRLAYPRWTHQKQPLQADRPMPCQVGIGDGHYDPGDDLSHHRYAGVWAGVIVL